MRAFKPSAGIRHCTDAQTTVEFYADCYGFLDLVDVLCMLCQNESMHYPDWQLYKFLAVLLSMVLLLLLSLP